MICTKNKTHYTQDPEKKRIAYAKRFTTNISKHGSCGSVPSQVARENTKKAYQKNITKLNEITQIISKEKLNIFFNKKETHYTAFLGKARNRTLFKMYPAVYKSLFVHTDFLKEFWNHDIKARENKIPFSFRVLTAGKHNFNFERKYYCRCGKSICFMKHAQEVKEHGYCKEPGCRISPNTIEHYLYTYGNVEGQKKWNEVLNKTFNNSEWKEKYSLTHRLAYQKRQNRKDTNFHAIGLNEESLLNKQEIIDNCKIIRDFTVAGYYPDGYCKETNTVYEVYERYHNYPKQKERDTIRQKIIQDTLKCNFVIIYDNEHRRN